MNDLICFLSRMPALPNLPDQTEGNRVPSVSTNFPPCLRTPLSNNARNRSEKLTVDSVIFAANLLYVEWKTFQVLLGCVLSLQ